MRRFMLVSMLLFAANASAEDFQADWDIQGLTYEERTYSSLSLDLSSLPRYISANGIIYFQGGQLFRPVDGTCVVEAGGDVVCILHLDALNLSLRINTTPVGSVELRDTQTDIELASGTLSLTSLQ